MTAKRWAPSPWGQWTHLTSLGVILPGTRGSRGPHHTPTRVKNKVYKLFGHHVQPKQILFGHVLLTLGAHAQRGLYTVVVLSVCLCVCVDAYSGTTGYESAPLADSELREPENLLGDFPETTSFERYAVKTSEKANMHNRTGLTAT